MEEVKPQGSYLKAIALAFVLGLIGVAAWILIGGYANFISAWIAFIIAVGISIRFGYDKAKGPKKGRAAIIIAIYVVQVFISIYLMYYIIISSVLPIGFFDVFPILFSPALQSAEVTLEYILVIVFSVLGLVFLFISDIFIKIQQKFNSGESKAKTGTRFITKVQFKGNYEEISARIDELLKKNNYNLQNYGDEQVYRSGDGTWVASKFIKYSNSDDGILIEAFVIIGKKEQGLDGFVGVAAKKPLKKIVDEIIDLIKNH